MKLSNDHLLLKLSTDLGDLCDPLLMFDIHHFSYMKQYADGRRYNLSNKPQWIDDYYNLGLYKSSLFEDLPLYAESKFDIWVGDYDIDVCRHGKLYYNTLHTITIAEANPTCRETFLFSTSPDNPNAIYRLSNHIDVLYHFIAYLKDRGAKLFSRADTINLRLNDNKPVLPLPHCSDNVDNLIKQFYQKTRVYKYYLEQSNSLSVKLTDREIDCLFHLQNNRNANETAKIMNLSRRTVESYLDNIRLKLNCTNKSELFRLIHNDKYLRSLRN